jgi:hypothetical protein
MSVIHRNQKVKNSLLAPAKGLTCIPFQMDKGLSTVRLSCKHKVHFGNILIL